MPAKTSSGGLQFQLVKAPDGTDVEVLFRQVQQPDGALKWEPFIGSVPEATTAFEVRFNDTDTYPANWEPGTDVAIEAAGPVFDPHAHGLSLVISEDQARRLHGELAKVCGFPVDVKANGISADRIAAFKRDTARAETYRKLCLILGGEWREVAKCIP